MIILFYDWIPSKKNSKKIVKNFKTWRTFIVSSEEFKIWDNMMKASILANSTHLLEWEKLEDFKEAEWLYFSWVFYQKNRNWRFDMTNTIQGIEDLLVEAWYIKDDNKKILNSYYYKYKDIKHEDTLFCIISISKEKHFFTEELENIYSDLKIKNNNLKDQEWYNEIFLFKEGLKERKKFKKEKKLLNNE